MDVLLCECVNDLHHSLFHLLNCLITTASKLKEYVKVIGSKVWTIGRVTKCLDAHLGQIVCDKDGVVDWWIVLVEMPLTRFDSDGISPWTPLKPQRSNPNPYFCPISSGVLTSLPLPHLSSSLIDSLSSLNLWCHSKTDARFMQDGLKAVWSVPYFSVAFFPSLKQNFIAYRS